jgi:hypothetical protein
MKVSSFLDGIEKWFNSKKKAKARNVTISLDDT